MKNLLQPKKNVKVLGDTEFNMGLDACLFPPVFLSCISVM